MFGTEAAAETSLHSPSSAQPPPPHMPDVASSAITSMAIGVAQPAAHQLAPPSIAGGTQQAVGGGGGGGGGGVGAPLQPQPTLIAGGPSQLQASSSHLQQQQPPPQYARGPLLTAQYAAHAIHCFLQAIQLGAGSRLEDTLRLMMVWFDHGDKREIYEQLRDSLRSVPVETWLEVVPQLMARMDSKRNVGLLVKQVVIDIARAHPQVVRLKMLLCKQQSGCNSSFGWRLGDCLRAHRRYKIEKCATLACCGRNSSADGRRAAKVYRASDAHQRRAHSMRNSLARALALGA